MGNKKTSSAFTLIELLVVIAIIATIAAFAVPALTSALTKGQMTGTMNNARQLYLAGYQMAIDGATNAGETCCEHPSWGLLISARIAGPTANSMGTDLSPVHTLPPRV